MRPLDPRVLCHLRPARGPLLAVVAAGLAGGLLVVAQAVALGTLVVRLVTDPTGPGWHAAAAALLGVVVLRALFGYAGDTAAARAAGLVSAELRRRLLRAVVAGRARGPGRPAEAELVLLATRGAAGVEPYVTRYLPTLVLAAVLPVLTTATIWWLDWLSGLVVLLTLPLVPLFAALVGLATRDRAARQWRLMGTLSGHFLDVVRGLPTLVAHRRAEAQVETIGRVTDAYRRATVHTLRLAFASSTVLELVATLSVALVAVGVGLRLASGGLDFRTALVVLLLAPEAYWPLRRVGAEFHASAEGAAVLAQADEVLAALAAQPRGGRRTDVVELRLDALVPGHPGGEPLTAPVTLSLPVRGLVAVTGPSGCGKSTLLETLRGRLDPLSGAVRVGGVALGDLDPHWWRSQVAWAPQRPWLTASSIAANVRLGRPEASDAQVRGALLDVGLLEAVDALPEGMDTQLGEDGAGLSAGQRARVGLARVLLAQRPVVLLDEPSAHLDEETELVLLTALRELAAHSLVVVVAHRRAVVEAADLTIELAAAPAGEPVGAPVPVPPARPPAPTPAPAAPRRWRPGLATASALGSLATASGVALTATAAWLITRAAEHPPVLVLMVAIVGVRTFGLARPVLRHAERVIGHDAALRELAERRTHVYADLVPLVPGRLGPRRGDLLASVVDDVDSLLDARLRVRQPLVTAVSVGAGAGLFAGLAEPRAGLVVLAVAASGAMAFGLSRLRTARSEPTHLRHRAALATRVEELVSGAGELEQWQASEPALAGVEREAEALSRAVRRGAGAVAWSRLLVLVAAAAGVVGIAATGARAEVSPAMLALLTLLPFGLLDATTPLADAGALSVRTRAARDRLEALAALEPAVHEPATPQTPPTGHTVALRGVSAGWNGRVALREQDLVLRPGERIGVCGPSGSGKSTLAALLMRFIDPDAGSVTLEGTDLRVLRLDDVRARIGLVDDDPHVFASSVVENVRLARPAAGDREVADALEAARLGDWIATLPRGMQTVLGMDGRGVSGGERARIALARALLADQPVLVLDEPTAHLDAATARAVARDVLQIPGRADRSVVWITHGRVGLDATDRLVRLDARPPDQVSCLRQDVPNATAGSV